MAQNELCHMDTHMCRRSIYTYHIFWELEKHLPEGLLFFIKRYEVVGSPMTYLAKLLGRTFKYQTLHACCLACNGELGT